MSAPAAQGRARRIRRLPADAREEILRAARAIVEEDGHAGFTIDGVMARTGMTRSSFYHYFRNIDDLTGGVFEPVESKMVAAVDPWLSPEATVDPESVIRRSLREVVDVVERHRALVAALDAATSQHAVWAEWRTRVVGRFVDKTADYVRSLVDAGTSTVADPEAVARALILMNNAALADWARNREVEPPERLAETLTTIWTRALLAR